MTKISIRMMSGKVYDSEATESLDKLMKEYKRHLEFLIIHEKDKRKIILPFVNIESITLQD